MNFALPTYASPEAVDFADRSMEAVCYAAYWASTELARERGRYSSYTGSLWDQGVLPLDSLDRLAAARGEAVTVGPRRPAGLGRPAARIARYGMRNSNCVAPLPDGDHRQHRRRLGGIEPTTRTSTSKSNLSGEFTVVNDALVRDLKALDLWDEVMVADLNTSTGRWPASTACRRNSRPATPPPSKSTRSGWSKPPPAGKKWIDQSQSLNLCLALPSGKKLDELYKLAWQRGLKTTYYLRTWAPANGKDRRPGRRWRTAEAPKFCSSTIATARPANETRTLPLARLRRRLTWLARLSGTVTTMPTARPATNAPLRFDDWDTPASPPPTAFPPTDSASQTSRWVPCSPTRRPRSHRRWPRSPPPTSASSTARRTSTSWPLKSTLGLGILPQGQPQPLDAAGNPPMAQDVH